MTQIILNYFLKNAAGKIKVKKLDRVKRTFI